MKRVVQVRPGMLTGFDFDRQFGVAPVPTIVSLCMMEDVPMPIIQRQLGHASLATTDTYLSHIAPKLVIETMGRREWSP